MYETGCFWSWLCVAWSLSNVKYGVSLKTLLNVRTSVLYGVLCMCKKPVVVCRTCQRTLQCFTKELSFPTGLVVLEYDGGSQALKLEGILAPTFDCLLQYSVCPLLLVLFPYCTLFQNAYDVAQRKDC